MLLIAPKTKGHATLCRVMWRSTRVGQEVEPVEGNMARAFIMVSLGENR